MLPKDPTTLQRGGSQPQKLSKEDLTRTEISLSNLQNLVDVGKLPSAGNLRNLKDLHNSPILNHLQHGLPNSASTNKLHMERNSEGSSALQHAARMERKPERKTLA